MVQLQFPQDKSKAGPAYWGTIHNTVSKYPDNPTEDDKKKMASFLEYLISNFVCESCIVDSQEYMKEHKIDYSSKAALSRYFCDFHNYVNRKLNKEVVDCDFTVHDTCPSCSVKSIKGDLESFKKNAKNIINNICKEEGLESPNIYFQPCPDNTSTSCITFKDKDDKADIFINPYSASLRTILHETKHYIDIKKGNSVAEIPADNYAIDRINKDFIFDSYKTGDSKIVAMDEGSITVEELPSIEKAAEYKNMNMKIYHEYPSLHRIDNLFEKPSAHNAIEKVNAAEGEVHKNVLVADNNDDFILSSLNSIFAWPASIVGVSPSSMTMRYVGAFITDIALYLISSNFSTFGSSFVSLISSISLFTGSIIFKNNIGTGDRGFIQGIISMLLMNGIGSLVPKKRDVMSEGLRLFVEGVKSFDLSKIKDSLFFDEKVFEINKSVIPVPEKNKYKDGKVSNALLGASAGVNQNRNSQLISQMQNDIKNYPTNYSSGEKNTVPSYANASLESIANSYAKNRMIPQSGSSSDNSIMDGIDMNELAQELENDILEM